MQAITFRVKGLLSQGSLQASGSCMGSFRAYDLGLEFRASILESFAD